MLIGEYAFLLSRRFITGIIREFYECHSLRSALLYHPPATFAENVLKVNGVQTDGHLPPNVQEVGDYFRIIMLMA